MKNNSQESGDLVFTLHASDDVLAAPDSALQETPDFGVWRNDVAISGAEITADGSVHVHWADGSTDLYHRLWLRDHCPCPACHHPVTRESIVELSKLDPALRPVEVSHTEATIQIIWGGDRHISSYLGAWLQGNKPGSNIDTHGEFDKWGAGFALPTFEASDIFDNLATRRAWLEALYYTGISVIHNLETTPGQVAKLASLGGFVRDTTFGNTFHVINRPEDANTNANLSCYLPLHTDLPTREYAPGLQYLHAMVNEADGGENVFADGWKIAETLKTEAPEHYEALTTIPCTFQNRDRFSDHRVSFPAIRLDHRGNPYDIRINTFLRGAPTNLTHEETDRMYTAMLYVFRMTEEPRFQVRNKLRTGDCVAFQNRRILHSRTAFDPASGDRHLEGCYTELEDLVSAVRVLRRLDV